MKTNEEQIYKNNDTAFSVRDFAIMLFGVFRR